MKWLFVLGCLLAIAALGYSFYSYYIPKLSITKPVVIERSTGAQALLSQLHDEGVLPPLPVIALPFLLTSDYNALKAGEYEFEAGSTPADVIRKIIRGDIVIHKITIPEGWNSFAVRAALMNEPMLTGDLPPQLTEGSILPDTMRFTRGESRTAVLERMQKAQTDLLAKLWLTRAPGLPVLSPEHAVILASVVEKETGVADERAMVAGVFVNRLRLGMKLQSDPTVVYGLELRQGGAPLGHALTRGELQFDTPYNTYTRDGLPPGPICNPGRKAIEAVLNPAATDALYFVATGNGGHNFAATLEQHEKNVTEYRKAIKND